MNAIGCQCLERTCRHQHLFARAWVCDCVDPTCKEPIHVIADDEEIKEEPVSQEADEKIKEEPIQPK